MDGPSHEQTFVFVDTTSAHDGTLRHTAVQGLCTCVSSPRSSCIKATISGALETDPSPLLITLRLEKIRSVNFCWERRQVNPFWGTVVCLFLPLLITVVCLFVFTIVDYLCLFVCCYRCWERRQVKPLLGHRIIPSPRLGTTNLYLTNEKID